MHPAVLALPTPWTIRHMLLAGLADPDALLEFDPRSTATSLAKIAVAWLESGRRLTLEETAGLAALLDHVGQELRDVSKALVMVLDAQGVGVAANRREKGLYALFNDAGTDLDRPFATIDADPKAVDLEQPIKYAGTPGVPTHSDGNGTGRPAPDGRCDTPGCPCGSTR